MIRLSIALVLALISTSFAAAEAGMAAERLGIWGSYEAGYFHTLLGLDHLIAMIAVGLISSQMGGRAVWQIPLVFLIALIVGGALGLILPESGFERRMLGASEEVIRLSDILLPVFIIALPALARQSLIDSAFAIIGGCVIVFGLYHGFAHGGEIAEGANAFFYVLGFSTISLVMHAVGVGIGEAARIFRQPRVVRAVSAALLLGIAIPYAIDFWNSILPDTLVYIFEL